MLSSTQIVVFGQAFMESQPPPALGYPVEFFPQNSASDIQLQQGATNPVIGRPSSWQMSMATEIPCIRAT